MKTCRIFAAGQFELPREACLPADLTIAADGGYSYLPALGIEPDIIVGDFDSLGFVPSGREILRHPVRKDDTDTMLALRTGLARGCDTFYLYGGTGGRMDHTLANLAALQFLAESGACGYLIDKVCCVTVLKNGFLTFDGSGSGTLSVFACGGGADGVTLTGLSYPLTDASLTADVPLGVSNAFTGVPARVAVKQGCLLVFWEGGFSCLTGRGSLKQKP